MTRSALRLLGALFASLLLVPAAAHAAQVNGDPLSVATSDDTGSLGVTFTGSFLPEFFGSSVDRETGAITPARSAGFVVVTVDDNGTVQRYGSRAGNVTPNGAPAVTGSGSPADPYRIVQFFTGGDGELELRQEVTYVNGETQFRAKLDVTNKTQTNLQIRASMGADMAGGGNDSGTGLFDAGPPRFVGGFNPDVGSVAGLSEITGWSAYEEGQYSEVLGRADSDPRSDRLQNTVDPKLVDYGAAVQWDQGVGGIGPGGTANYEVAWRFARTYDLTPENQTLNTGDAAVFKVKTSDLGGRAQSQRIRYVVVGSNNTAGDVRTDRNGEATFEYIGANPGTDRVSAYVDQNDNGVRDEGEPQREANVEWVGPDAPQFATEVNVRPTRGTVLVKLPRGASVKGKWAEAAQSGFVRLTEAKQLPVGTQMDTKRGSIALTSSKGPTGGVQTAQFYSGRFVVKQPRRERGMTEVVLSETMRCTSSRRRGKVIASAVRSRRLWGRGKGRFRTRGRHSTATVRGTTWLQKDSCRTTTTIVREGTVIVKDFAKRKNVRVKAPKRYVARARRR